MPLLTIQARPDKRRTRRYRVTTVSTDGDWDEVYSRGELPNVDSITMHNVSEQTIYYIGTNVKGETKPQGGDQHFDQIAPGETVTEEANPLSIRVCRADTQSIGELVVIVYYFSEEAMGRVEESKGSFLKDIGDLLRSALRGGN